MTTVTISNVTIDSMEVDLDQILEDVDPSDIVEAVGEEKLLDEMELTDILRVLDEDDTIEAMDFGNVNFGALASKVADEMSDWDELKEFIGDLLTAYERGDDNGQKVELQTILERDSDDE